MISHRELRDGLLVDYLSHFSGFREMQKTPTRDRSVLHLGRSCNFDEKHAESVTSLALELFDSAKHIGLHNLGDAEKELLKYSSTLHDVGDFLSFSDHHLHSHYIISNAGLLGFDPKEIKVMANIARFHRKKLPSRKSMKWKGWMKNLKKQFSFFRLFCVSLRNLTAATAALLRKWSLRKLILMRFRLRFIRIQIAALKSGALSRIAWHSMKPLKST